jgi:murein DD-endopeptidase MepM/ murein hydrolase activator NlpD
MAGHRPRLPMTRLRPLLTKPLLLLLVLVLALGLLSPAGAQSEIEQTREQVRAAQAEVDAAQARIDEAQARADAATAEFWAAQEAIYVLEDEMAQIEAQVAETEARLAQIRDEVQQIAIDRYMHAGEPSAIFASDNINDGVIADALATFVSQGRLDVVDEFRLLTDDMRVNTELLEERRAEQTALTEELNDKRAIINAELATLAAERDNLAGALTEVQSILGGLEEAERQRIEEELRIEREAEAARLAALQPPAAVTPAATSTSAAGTGSDPAETTETTTTEPTTTSSSGGGGVSISCPLSGAFSHSDDFYSPRAVGGTHLANDLLADEGTPVLAVVSGALSHRESSVGGLSAYLDGDDGNYYFFTHLSGYENVDAGHVGQGTVIGYVGETGNAPIPHLHFEIHQGGRGNPVNPYPLVQAAC